jgi:CheY-like chemotaxis protein
MTDRVGGMPWPDGRADDEGVRRRQSGRIAAAAVSRAGDLLPPDPRLVLIVEDDEGLSALIAGHLRARGHDVRVAATTREAAVIIGDGFAPSAIVLDIDLPGEPGWSLLGDEVLVRAGSPTIVVTSATRVRRSRLDASGIAGYLQKPFALASLVDAVEGNTRSGVGVPPADGADEADRVLSRSHRLRPTGGAPDGTRRPRPGPGSIGS